MFLRNSLTIILGEKFKKIRMSKLLTKTRSKNQQQQRATQNFMIKFITVYAYSNYIAAFDDVVNFW